MRHPFFLLPVSECDSPLLEGVLAQAVAGDGEARHVRRGLFAEVLIDVDLGEVLSQHKAMSTHTDQQTMLRIHDVARLGVVAGPRGLEADVLELRNPVDEHLRAHLQELLRIVLQLLAGLLLLSRGRRAADDLAGLRELLTIDGGEAFVLPAVDEHVQRVAVLTQHRQTMRDKGLVFNRI